MCGVWGDNSFCIIIYVRVWESEQAGRGRSEKEWNACGAREAVMFELVHKGSLLRLPILLQLNSKTMMLAYGVGVRRNLGSL